MQIRLVLNFSGPGWPRIQGDLPVSASPRAGITGMCHHLSSLILMIFFGSIFWVSLLTTLSSHTPVCSLSFISLKTGSFSKLSIPAMIANSEKLWVSLAISTPGPYLQH